MYFSLYCSREKQTCNQPCWNVVQNNQLEIIQVGYRKNRLARSTTLIWVDNFYNLWYVVYMTCLGKPQSPSRRCKRSFPTYAVIQNRPCREQCRFKNSSFHPAEHPEMVLHVFPCRIIRGNHLWSQESAQQNAFSQSCMGKMSSDSGFLHRIVLLKDVW